MPKWIKNAGEPIPDKTKDAAIDLFNQYAESQHDFIPPVAHFSFDEDEDTKALDVHIDVAYKDANYHLRSLNPMDHSIVYAYLNSQPSVREKYGNKKTVASDATEQRIKTLADRFDPKCTDGCFMHGGFYVTDHDTEDFLGIANSGSSGEKGLTEIAFLFRTDAWSRRPFNVVEEYHPPQDTALKKAYTGVGTATVCTLIQYTKELKEKNYGIKGEELEGIYATAMIDNPGSWKAMAKAGMKPYDIDANESYGPELRYQLKIKFQGLLIFCAIGLKNKGKLVRL